MRSLTLLLATLVCLACQNPESSSDSWKKNSRTILSGSIQNYNLSSMPSKMRFYFYDGMFKQVSSDVNIDSTGTFKAEFDLFRPQDVNLYYRNWLSVIMRPGDSIHLTFDGNQGEKLDLINSMAISGDSEALNNDFQNFLAHDSILNTFYTPIATISPEDFLDYQDSIFKLRNTYITNFIEDNPKTDPYLKSWLEVERTIVPITKIVEFPMYFRMYNRGKMDSLSYPKHFFDRVKELNQLKEDNFVNGKIGTLSNQLLFHYYDKVDKLGQSGNSKVKDSLLFELLKQDFPENPIPIQLALADRVRADLESMNTSFIENNIEEIRAIYGDTDFGEAIFKAFEDTKIELANMELPEGVDFLSFDASNPEDYLTEVIKKADGKVIYIDHWATWCAPCRSEFEYALPEFKEKYKDNIEFVYFCYSSNEEEWKPLIRKFHLEGMHYFVSDEETKILRQQMRVDGYPTYTIINQDGDIVKSDFQYRPSREVTSKVIDSLLQNKASL